MKPFVFLTALLNKNEKGESYLPTSLIKDEKFTTKYEKQNWSPDNYGNKYYGEVPLFFALKNSLNAATASLGLHVGVDKIVETARMFGIESELKPLPSLTLGSFEMYPREVLRAYMGLSQMGKLPEISFIKYIINEEGKDVYRHTPQVKSTVDEAAVASLVGMMKQTTLSGTARSVSLSGFNHPCAGKTGTTSDNKDAWFGGFTPYQTTIVWLGYDNNLSHKLTGASGALPVWIDFMKKAAIQFPPDDFAWPASVEKISLDESSIKKLNALQSEEDTKLVELIQAK
jgi:penicillin-binding protein 1B